MKFVYATLAVILATPAFAHPGHAAAVDGHTHTLAELALMGVLPALAAGALVLGIILTRRNRND